MRIAPTFRNIIACLLMLTGSAVKAEPFELDAEVVIMVYGRAGLLGGASYSGGTYRRL